MAYPQSFQPITSRNIEGTILAPPLVLTSTTDDITSEPAPVSGMLPGNQLYQSQSVDILMVNTGAALAYVTFASNQTVLQDASATNGLPLPPNQLVVVDLPGIMVFASVLGGPVSFFRGWGVGS